MFSAPSVALPLQPCQNKSKIQIGIKSDILGQNLNYIKSDIKRQNILKSIKTSL